MTHASCTYGTHEWFEREYARVREDPWGLTWRPSQMLRYSKLLAMLDGLPEPPRRVLDAGCATGDFTSLLARHVRGLERLLGIDFVEEAVARARARYPALEFAAESLFSAGQTYRGCFDLVACLEVLYYLPADRRAEALRSVRDALRPGGYALFSSFIAPPPYFRPREFVELIAGEFEILRWDPVHLRPISFVERIAGKVGLPRVFGRWTLPVAAAVERRSRTLGSLAASHTLVLARIRP